MAEPIVIKVTLDASDVRSAGEQIARTLSNALDTGIKAARDAGRRIGEALSAGIEAGLGRASREERERAHQRRIQAIHEQSAARIREIEARRQAQIDAIRERAVQRELEQQRRLERAAQSSGFAAFLRRFSSTIREAGESIQQAGFAFTGFITGPLLSLGRAAAQSAIQIDQQVNVLKALTGSAEQAERRFAQLIATAQKTPGLTTSLALSLDAQLRTLNVTERTIDRVLPAIGRLGAISPITDPGRFLGNLVQLVTQNFERQDLKELVGQSPLAGELIKQIFNVDSPTNAKAIREAAGKMGIRTVEDFFDQFARAAESNQKLQTVTESLGTQFQKLQDRLVVALRPLGVRLLEIIIPALERLVPAVEGVLRVFASLPPGLQIAVIAFGALAAAIGPVVIALGGLIQLAGAMGNLVTVLNALGAAGGVAAAGSLSLSAVFPPLLIGLAAVSAAVGLGVGAYQLYASATRDAADQITAATTATITQNETSQKQIDELNKLAEKTKLTRDEQEKIKKIYEDLNPVQQERVKLYAEEADAADALSGKLTGLIELLKQENEERLSAARQRALDQGKELIEQANLLSQRLENTSQRVVKLSEEHDRLAQATAKAKNENQVFFGGLSLRAFPLADTYQRKLNEVTAELDNVSAAQRRYADQLPTLAQNLALAAKQAGLTTEEFVRQVVATAALSGNLKDIESRVLGILSAAAALAPAQAPQENKPKPKPAPTGGGSDRASQLRAFREARLRAEESAQRNELDLLIDENNRLLKFEEELFKLRLRSADEFFKNKLGLLQANIGNEINFLNQQLIRAQEEFNRTRPQTAERERLAERINDLQTKLTLKTRELGDAEREVFSESIRARNDIANLTREHISLTDEQSERERKTLALIRERAQTQEAIIKAAREPLTERGQELDRAILETGANLDLKILNAQKQAILDIKRADEEAILSMERSRIRLADASIFHANRAQAIFMEHLANQQSVTEAVAEAQIKAFEGVAGSLDKGIDRLTKKLGVFGDVINGIIKSIVRNILANLFAPTFGGGGGGLLGSILGGVFGPIFGRGGGGFGTPPFVPAFAQAFAGGGGGISAPPSISLPGGLLGNIFRAGGGGTVAASTANRSTAAIDEFFGPNVPRTAGRVGGFSLGAIGRSLGAAAPFLGLSIGSALGGRSIPGQILGAVGAGVIGTGVGVATGAITSPAIAGLFANPFTIPLAAGLLVGGIFLGKARQRRQDEELSGQFLTQAYQALGQLKSAIDSGQITSLSEARQIFENQIIGTFVQQINTLKTESVRRSRLTNQVADLRRDFDNLIPPAIAEQERRRAELARFAAIDARLIPQFAGGGVVPGIDRGFDSVRALLRPGEMVLTRSQQAAIARMVGAEVFALAGVPGAGQQAGAAQAFQFGGRAQPFPASFDGPTIVIENITLVHGMSQSGAEELFYAGGSGETGRRLFIHHLRSVRLNERRLG